MNKIVNYIIVGQGIAGTVLAQTLLTEGESFLVIDEGAEHSASAIAPGLYNPVVYKRLVKSWMVDDLIPFMDTFYRTAEKTVQEEFYHKKQLIKLFAEAPEREFWLKKSGEEVGKYISKPVDASFLDEFTQTPFGSAEVKEAGNVDLSFFLKVFRAYFKKQGCLLEEKFDFSAVSFVEQKVRYKNIQADKIIFCEGYKALTNPYFKWLPFKLTKGEVITIHLNTDVKIPLEKVISKGVFMLPIGDNKYKVGATYEWEDLSTDPTEKGKEQLIEKLQKIIQVPFEVIAHQAGIRPTVVDRRPLIGLHPEHPELAVFNGMGTKGVMLAPYFAKKFVDFLNNKTSLPEEVNCNRFLQKAKS